MPNEEQIAAMHRRNESGEGAESGEEIGGETAAPGENGGLLVMDERDGLTAEEIEGALASGARGLAPVPGRAGFDLDHIFKYHAPSPGQLEAYNDLRNAAKIFAHIIVELTPAGADQSAALRHIREAVMTANASIALGGRL